MSERDVGRWSDGQGLDARVRLSESSTSGKMGYRNGSLSATVYRGEDRVLAISESVTFIAGSDLQEKAAAFARRSMVRAWRDLAAFDL